MCNACNLFVSDLSLINMSAKESKRNFFDKREKEIFLSILQQSESGRLWKVITEGTSKNQEKHDVWTKVAELFSENTGKNIDFIKAKQMWFRLKDSSKKKHDVNVIDKNFNKECAKTGGGTGPNPPEMEDGDNFINDIDLPDLDPVSSDFNRLVRPNERVRPSSSFVNETPAADIDFVFDPQPIIVQPSRKKDSNVNILQETMEENQILIVDESGSKKTVNVEVNTPKGSKKHVKKNMNDKAVDYYEKMIEVQERIAEAKIKYYSAKTKVLKRRAKSEKVSLVLLKHKLRVAGIPPSSVELLESEHQSSSDSSSERLICPWRFKNFMNLACFS